MNLQYNPYTWPALAGTLVAVLLCVRVWRRRPARGALPTAVLMLAVAVWCFGYALELACADLDGKIWWSKVEYLGIVTVPVASLVFALEYTGRERRLTRRKLAWLAIVPLLTLALVWTNERHGLFWSRFELDTQLPFAMSRPAHGIGFWVNWIYAYVLLCFSTFLILRSCWRSFALYRKQALALVIATLAPWIGNALYIFGTGPFAILDPTPYAFVITGAALAWGVYRFRLMDIVPVARETVMENLQEAVIVLDARNRIVDANPAALALMGCPRNRVIGESAETILADYSDLVASFRDVLQVHTEIHIGADPTRFFDLRISTLASASSAPSAGRIVVLQEITERKRAEEQLVRLNDELEVRVDQRTAELARTNETLRAEIVERRRVQEENVRRAEQMEALRQSSLELTAQLDVNWLLNSLSQRAVKLMGATTGSLYLYRPERVLLERVVRHGPHLLPSGPTRRKGEGLIGKVWETGRPLVVNDYRRWVDRNQAYDNSPTRAVLGIPMQWGGRFQGVVTITADPPRQFSQDDVRLLTLFADQASIALENARLYEQAQRDIAERNRVQAALSESEERYAIAARAANDGIWDWNLETGEIYLSPRWKAMLGFSDAEIGARPDDWFCHVHPDDLPALRDHLARHMERDATPLESEYRMRHRDGSWRWILVHGLAVHNEAGRVYRLAGSQSDITARKRAEEQLLHDAFHDGLTGLPNRALFIDRLGHALDISRREEHPFAVLFLDLDRFKIINDSLGHLNGDELLMAVAKRIEECVRAGDTVARLGGDEFVILVDGMHGLDDALCVAERIRTELCQPFELNGEQVFCSTSIGIAQNSHSYVLPEDMLRDADTAMYRAKALGGAGYAIFDSTMHDHAVSVLQLERELRRALENHELRLYYQPIVSLTSGKMTGVEALIRWKHPRRGTVPPSDFIPLAEESGLIIPIGEWVLRTACTQLRAWEELGVRDFYVAVNVSARQFQMPQLPELVGRILAESGIEGRMLHLEITESTATQNEDLALTIMDELTRLGVQIVIDDFGNNYSALGRLKNYPIAVLKIDQSFIRDLSLDDRNAAITTAIIAMAQGLRMDVIAEGVETEEQRRFLAKRNCDQMQGYLYSRPVSADSLTRLLLTDQTGA